ncbi:MAG: cobalamin biosynthesis protein, partial [Methanomicrobium sp.]|nr:cobalamin biosynthesis protein [Methanomicrobium sp.]
MALAVLTLLLSLVIDRLMGDPQSRFHPVAMLGSLRAVWGRPGLYPVRIQRIAGVVFALATACIFTLPFLIVERCLPLAGAHLSPILSAAILVIVLFPQFADQQRVEPPADFRSAYNQLRILVKGQPAIEITHEGLIERTVYHPAGFIVQLA